MKKTLLTLLSSFALFIALNAQVSIYSFATSAGTYTPITGGTVLGDTTIDEQRFVDPSALAGSTTVLTGVGFPIGFNFTYNNQVFDRFAVNTNGWISLGQSSLTPSVNINSSISFSNILSATSTATPAYLRSRILAFGDDIEGQNGSELRIETIGTAPNRICVIQWKNYKKFLATSGDSYNFQLRLKETTNVIEVVYGNFTNNSSANTAQVGLGGTTNADYNARTTTTSWTATTAATSNTANLTVTSSIKPASGLTFAWTPGAPCSGTPTAGTASSSVSSVCGGIAFDLTLTGYTSNASGITLQWQSASSLGGTYTNIAGATSATYSASQTATTYYKCLVSCSGGTAVASNVVTVTINAPNACYCTPLSGGTSCITNVTIGSLNRNSSACENSPSYYTSVPVGTATTTINQGTTYPISVTNGTGSAAIISVWIDYNQNGTFENSEWNQVSINATASSTSTVNIVVPVNATLGQTAMRVRSRAVGSSNGATDACTDFFSGETEDYVVTIGAGTACTGTPVTGTASSSVSSVCATIPVVLTLTGYTNASGITFQWQSSATTGGTYTNIVGATTPVYTTTQTATTYYKCVVTCSGTSASSNIVPVTMSSQTACLCTPPSTDCTDDDMITNVTFGTINNTTACSANGYSAYTSSTPTLLKSQSYPISVTVDSGGTEHVAVWIDYNQNGTFDTTEFTSIGSGIDTTLTSSITIPSTASAGTTLMRVRVRYNTALTSSGACIAYTYGETEDYAVNISGSNVGIEENSSFNSVSIYPNPSTGLFNIVANNVKAETITVQVLDLQGKVVYSAADKSTSANYNKSINLEGIAKGLYYIKLTSENGSKVQKIVIQ